MKMMFKDFNNNDRVNIAKGLKFLYNRDFIKLDMIEIDFEQRRIIDLNHGYTMMFDSIVCIDFTKYNK